MTFRTSTSSLYDLVPSPRANQALLLPNAMNQGSERWVDRMRVISIAIVFGVVACDPGASFHVEGAPDGIIAWRQGADSVVARVHAHTFTIDLTAAVEVIASSATALELDSSTVRIRDRYGDTVAVERSWNSCYNASSGSLNRRCVIADANLHSIRYDRLDSMTVQFGYAVLNGHRVPLTTVFRKDR
jgi:hypothetical protein